MDITKLQAGVATLVGDVSKLTTDFKAFLATVTPTDPAQQAAIDALTTQIAGVDANIAAMDTAVQPAPVPEPTTTAPPTTQG